MVTTNSMKTLNIYVVTVAARGNAVNDCKTSRVTTVTTVTTYYYNTHEVHMGIPYGTESVYAESVATPVATW